MIKYFWALIESGSTVVFQFLSIVILSRLLTPEDYGIIGMMTIFITVGNILIDSGMGGALIKKQDANKEDYSTLFWFNMLVSVGCYVVLYILSFVLSDFYNLPEFGSCLQVYGLSLIIAAFGVVQNTKLIKDLKFKQMAIIAFIANLFGLVVAIVMAYKGYGYWSLVAQQMVYIFVRVVLQVAVNRFVPQRMFSRKSFIEQFRFGGSLMVSNIVNVVYNNIISSIIPKVGTITQNGMYAQATKIQHVPVNIITSVTDKVLFPVLSKCDNSNHWLQSVRKSSKMIVAIAFGALLLCIVFSNIIVRIVLGEAWMEVVPYLKILLLAAFGIVYQYVARNILKSRGETSAILKAEVAKSVLGLVAIFISVRVGIMFMLWTYVAVSLGTSVIYAWLLKKQCSYSVQKQLADMIVPIIVMVCSFFVVLGLEIV